MWAKFDTLENFNAWHDAIKTKLGIPLSDGITTEYTTAHLVSDGSYSAWVELDQCDGLEEGLPFVKERVWQ